jgi:hypothetical protein
MTTYLLRRPSTTDGASVPVPTLDASQRAVVEHDGGPLLVLAGPGTGKTTTMVEAVVDLVEHRGVDPSQVLALTFSRKAAEQLRDRVTARLGRTTGADLASTFHSFAYSLIREWAPTDAYSAPLRLLSAPVQDVVLRELLQPTPEAVAWPESLQEAVRTRGFSREVQALLARARERGLSGADLARLGREQRRPAWVAAGQFLEQYLDVLDAGSALDYADLIVRAGALAERPDVRRRLRERYSWVFVDEYQDTDPSQVALLRSLAGDGRNLVVVGDPDQSIYGFRGADVRGILDFPDAFRDQEGAPAPRVASAPTSSPHPGTSREPCRPMARSRARPSGTSGPRSRARPSSAPEWSRWCTSTLPAPRSSTPPTGCAGPTSRTASAGPTWRCWCGADAPPSRGCGARSSPRGCRSRSRPTTPRWWTSLPSGPCSTRCAPRSTSASPTRRTPPTSTPTERPAS